MQSGGESTREKRVSYVDTVDTDSRRGKRSWKGDLGHRVQHPRKTTTNHRTGSDSSWWRDYGYGSWQGEGRAGTTTRPPRRRGQSLRGSDGRPSPRTSRA